MKRKSYLYLFKRGNTFFRSNIWHVDTDSEETIGQTSEEAGAEKKNDGIRIDDQQKPGEKSWYC